MSLIILPILMFGIAVFLPGFGPDRRDWLGVRCLIAIMALPVALYLFNVVLQVPLDIVAWSWAAIGAVGVVQTLARDGRNREGRRILMRRLAHPAWTLLLVVWLVAAMHKFPGYTPYPGDEVASWLKLSKQIFLANDYWSEAMDYHLGAYTDGWPLVTAFPALLFGRFDENYLAPVPFLFHLALLGAAYDILRDLIRRQGGADGLPGLLAALMVFGLVSLEALWVLFPSDMLIDRPMIYVWAGILLVGLHGMAVPGETDRHAAVIGLIAAAGYLFKVAQIAALPAMGMIWLAWVWLGRKDGENLLADWKKALLRAALMLVPFVIAYVSWIFFKTADNCLATPWSAYDSPLGMFQTEKARLAADAYIAAAIDYLGAYKLPLTLLGGAGLVAALADRRLRWFSLSVIAFVIPYSFAHYMSYIGCLDIERWGGLESFERYFRPNLRMVHFCGLIAIGLLFAGWLKSRGSIGTIIHNERFRFAGGFMVIVLLSVLALQADRSMLHGATRYLEGEPLRSKIFSVPQEGRYLTRVIRDEKLGVPKVSVIAQGGYNVELELARYAAIKSDRDDIGEEGFFHYRVSTLFSYGTEPGNFARKVISEDDLLAHWKTHDVLWPIMLDDWVRGLLGRLTGGGCDGPYEEFFLLKSEDGSFRCTPKVEQPGG